MANIPISNMTATWSDSGTTYAAIKIDVTDTASATASALLNLQVGGVSKFKVSKAGDVTANTVTANVAVNYAQINLLESSNLYSSLAGTVPSNTVKLNARNYLNRQFLSHTNSSGVETLLQSHLGYKYFLKVQPGVGTGVVSQPGTLAASIVNNTNNMFYETIGSGISLLVNTSAGYSVVNPTYSVSNPLLNGTRRFKINSTQPSQAMYLIENGNYLTLPGGFFFTTKFCIESFTGTGLSLFVGLWDQAPTAPAGAKDFMDVTYTAGRIGVTANTHTGNLFVISAGSSPNNLYPSAILDLGSNFPVTGTGNLYELTMSSQPSSNVIYYSVTNLVSGASANGSYTIADIPTAAVSPILYASNDSAGNPLYLSSTGYYVEYN